MQWFEEDIFEANPGTPQGAVVREDMLEAKACTAPRVLLRLLKLGLLPDPLGAWGSAGGSEDTDFPRLDLRLCGCT